MMRRAGAASASRQRITVDLHSSCRSYSRFDVEALVAPCPGSPDLSAVGNTRLVAGRLTFSRWLDAVEAVAYLWRCRLDGAHGLLPRVGSPADLSSTIHREINGRLRPLFAERARLLLDGESVRRCRQRAKALSNEIQVVRRVLRRPQKIFACSASLDRIRGLEAELALVNRKLEGFRDAIQCILAQLEGSNGVDSLGHTDRVDVFWFAGDLNWVQIQSMMERECRRLDEGLPIYTFRQEILQQVHSQQVMLLIGETGSGKSTQLVQYLADSGLAADKSIVCTQPRKIAAISLAERVREESDGCYSDGSVACCPTYSSAQSFNQKIIFMTDHCLLQQFINKKIADSISYIVVDEAHERSLNTDLLLALVKKLLLQSDLRLIIMSATADENKLSDYFFGCKAFHVKGRSFPVNVRYVPNVDLECSSFTSSSFPSGCASYVSDAVKMACDIHKTQVDGAVLTFLTSQAEVEWACEHFEDPSAVALPLHGKLSCDEQARIFESYPGKRKIIFSTNVAETSLTIPGVKYVVDSGMVKDCRFEPKSGMNVLRVCKVSQSSARQRAGRAGRTEPGKCYRLYTECDFQSMALHSEPEILRVNLGIAVLRILSLGIKDVQDFDFVDAPSSEAIETAIRNLIQLDAVVCCNAVFELTDIGRRLVKLGTEPRVGKLVLDSFQFGLGKEGLVLAAVMSNANNIFCRVGTDEDKSKSDCLKVSFCHHDGDLFTLLAVYKEWEAESQQSRNGWCWRNSINAKTMRRCRETVFELEHCLQHELNLIVPSYWRWDPQLSSRSDKLLKKVILSSHTENVAFYSGYDRLGYEVALTGQHVQLHPSCSLLICGQNPSWVVFGEILSISNQYLVCVTSIDVDCLLELHPSPPFDVLSLESRKLQKFVVTGLGDNLLRRFCGKMNKSLHSLVSRVRTDCMDSRIGIDVDFEKHEIYVLASSADMGRVSGMLNDALECERKWLQNECIEKCICHGGSEFSSPVAVFGSGAEIKHLEMDKKYLSVEISHSNAHALDDKELLMIVDQYASGLANFCRYGGVGQEGADLSKWGRITFLGPQYAERAVEKLNSVQFNGSLLKVSPARTLYGADRKLFSFPAVKAKVLWPRRLSKGVAFVKCASWDVTSVVEECSGMVVGGRSVRCERSRNHTDCVIINGLDKDVSEPELANALRNATKKRILDVFLLRGEAVSQPNGVACADALLREISHFMPNKNSAGNNCWVQVYPPDPKDYVMKAQVTFDGSLHLEAAKALQHIEGKVLPGCLSWQKIQCQQLFYSYVSCPAPVYMVIKKELDSLLQSFRKKIGVSCNLDQNENGSYRVKISSNATKKVAELRMPLEKLMKGKTLSNTNLTSSVLQLLFCRDGFVLMKDVQRETGTYFMCDKHNLSVKVFGPSEAVAIAEEKLVNSLLKFHENKQLEIHLRGRHLPRTLMKEVVRKFGADLHGLMEKVPGTDFVLNTRHHILSVRGTKELKQKVEEIIDEIAHSLSGNGMPAEEADMETTCPICLCDTEDGYCLEACGHKFCRMCLIDQCESLIRSRDGFPLCCARQGCNKKIWLVDLRCLLSIDKLDEFFRSSLGAFVESSGGAYRFCPSPDCPSVYKVVDPDTIEEQPPFVCGACFVETCRKCHLEYHPSVSCEKYKEFKIDPDTSLLEWRKGKDNVKNCPICGYTIEKSEGCNHMECRCGKHICWVCLESFDSSQDCYGHLRNVHNSVT